MHAVARQNDDVVILYWLVCCSHHTVCWCSRPAVRLFERLHAAAFTQCFRKKLRPLYFCNTVSRKLVSGFWGTLHTRRN